MSSANLFPPLNPDYAFSAGADLWVINSDQNKWWQEIDFRSDFLLSSSLLYPKQMASAKIEQILKQTEMIDLNFESTSKNLLLGTESHFFNKWVFVISEDLKLTLPELEKTSQSLKAMSIRFFGFPKETITSIAASLSTSLLQISYVE
ncbi:MAG: hypothetical protein WA160_06035 [Pseudobdellovibrio sp.]